MKYILICIFALCLLTTNLFAVDQTHRKIDQPAEKIPPFIGFDKRSIVIKISPALLDQINFETAREQAVTGIERIDVLNRRYKVEKFIQKYPDMTTRQYRGRTINPRTWFRVSFRQDIDGQDVARAYRSLRGVVDAQPVGIHTVEARLPNDPDFSNQYHLNQANDHDIDAPEAWDVETGNEQIIVAVLDTGVRYYHKDLGGANASPSNTSAARGNMWINNAELNGTAGVDDDNNGYKDDWIGWDFVTGKSGVSGEDVSTPDNDPRDFNGHGTHTSGIVGAINNNNLGVSSVAGGWNNGSQAVYGNGVKVMGLRIGWSGRYFFWEVGYIDMGFAADAFYYAADNGARIASCSWGSSNSGGLADAIDYFLAGGGLLFKSAGNDDDESTDYINSRSDVISVAATDANDIKADFSSYGTWVDISAPGDEILSTYHDHNNADQDEYAYLSGTSMATPLAAGTAALLWSHHPEWTADQVKQRLFDTADDIDGLAGNSSYAGKLGAGRVNAFNAVNDGLSNPPVADFTADPTSGCPPLTVNFTDQSSGDISSWSWDFGDGSTSTEQNPTHQYTAAGTYTVTLQVNGPGGSDSKTKTDLITVFATITANFSADPTSGDAPLTVNFSDLSSGDVTAWSWDFGDGGSSTLQNPSHEYSSAGTYTVSLTASNSCDSDIETKTNYITVNEPAGNPPVADFIGSPTSGEAPLTVNFTDQSSNNPTSWSWDFGDGGTSTVQNPAHQYANAGTYTVSLTATNQWGSDVETKVNYINVTEPAQNLMHVSEINVIKQTFWVINRGKADIRIVDAAGAPVSDATVSGTWSGPVSDQDQVSTDSDGWATAYSNWIFGDGTFTFCVDNVTKSGWTYDEAANVVSCASSDGTSSAVEVVKDINLDDIEAEIGFKLAFNTPNPFNPTTTITYYVPEMSQVKIEIFNITGQRVKVLVNRTVQVGLNTVTWDARDNTGNRVSSGFYIYTITYDNRHTLRRKILLLK